MPEATRPPEAPPTPRAVPGGAGRAWLAAAALVALLVCAVLVGLAHQQQQRLADAVQRAPGMEAAARQQIEQQLQRSRQALAWGAALSLALLGAVGAAAWRADRRRAARERDSRLTVQALGEGVLVFDAQGWVRDGNAAAERILGQSLDEMKTQRGGPSGKRLRADGSPYTFETHPLVLALSKGQNAAFLTLRETEQTCSCDQYGGQ